MFPSRPSRLRSTPLALLFGLVLVLAACGGGEDDPADPADDAPSETDDPATEPDEDADDDADEAADDADRLEIVVTTSILGDIVEQLVQDDGDVTVLMPPGADPHAYEPSAQEAAMLREGDLVIANGLMLEENLVSALEAAQEEGVDVFELADQLDPIEFDWDGPGHSHGDEDDHGHDDEGDDHSHDDDGDDHGHDDEGDDHGHDDEGDDHGHEDEGDDHSHDDEGDDHGHEDEGDDHSHDDDGDDHGHDDEGDDHGHDDDHDHGPEDPHIWFDPIRMADGVELIAAEIASVDERLDEDEWMERAEAYVDELLEVHEEMEEQFDRIPEENRVLVTNHDALGYLANRYGFEVLGTVIPGSSTQAEADPSGFAELIETVEEADVPAIFAENTDSTVLAEQLASEVVDRGDLEVEVVRIYTDALGEEGSGAETYLDLLRTSAQLIADALS
jgi:zinc/manganese transport system substrate-binding protein